MSGELSPSSNLQNDSVTGQPVPQKSIANGAFVSVRSHAGGSQVGEKTEYASSTMTATGSGAIIDTPDISDANSMFFIVSGLTVETVGLAFYLDESKTLLTAAVAPINLATGAVTASASLANGSYKITDLAARFARFTKSAITETPTITYLARG